MFWKITLLVCRQMMEIHWRKSIPFWPWSHLALMSPGTLLVLNRVFVLLPPLSKMETCYDKILTFLPDRQESVSICCPVPVIVCKYPFSWPWWTFFFHLQFLICVTSSFATNMPKTLPCLQRPSPHPTPCIIKLTLQPCLMEHSLLLHSHQSFCKLPERNVWWSFFIFHSWSLRGRQHGWPDAKGSTLQKRALLDLCLPLLPFLILLHCRLLFALSLCW